MKRLQHLPASGGAVSQKSGLLCGGDRGFTKIEALVVMALIGIFATFARPGFSRWLPEYYLKAAARDLYSNLQLAKAGAVRDRAEWAVRFIPGTNCYELWSWGSNGVWDGYSEPNDTLVKTVKLMDYGGGCSYGPGSATRKVGKNEPIADTVSYPGDRVVFDSRGITVGTLGGYAYLQNNRNACFAVGTWSTGIVVIRKWAGSAWE
jgi:prepilin-type N-terminal cleavage/methylation domain-containing protein